MANLPESSSFDAGVYQLEVTDPVQGGASGVSNTPLKNLVNRTRWLYDQITAILSTIAGLASSNNATLTGTPTAPTVAGGDNSTKIATTAFAANAIYGVASVNVAGAANVTLTAAQYGLGIIVLSGAITANINVIFPVNGDWIVYNNTTGAFTITCKTAAGTGVVITQGFRRPVYGDGTNIATSRTDFQDLALTGVPTAPTAAANTNTTQVATTAFVQAAQGDALSKSGGGAITGATTAVTQAKADRTQLLATTAFVGSVVADYAPSASPTFTGAPASTTPPVNDNTTRIATTAWAWANIQAMVSSVIAATATAAGFVFSVGGYIKLPSWLGGFMIQWQGGVCSAGTGIAFPIQFPNACLGVLAIPNAANTTTYGISCASNTPTGTTVYPNTGGGGATILITVISFGY